MRIWKFPDQVVRLVILFAVLLAALIVLRQRFVPESFGELGHFRAEAITANTEIEPRFAGAQACEECHEVGEKKRRSFHRGVACETCHGAAAAHVDAPDEFTPRKPTSREACLYCHRYVPSRPTGFPQVMETAHNPTERCVACHDPHDPTPPEVPSSCSACHASVARTKSVSHHATLECETCHQVEPEHRESPRVFPAKKPTDREFCGQCHSKTADSDRSIPRIDLIEHGERYVCWQCHYPHFPEGR